VLKTTQKAPASRSNRSGVGNKRCNRGRRMGGFGNRGRPREAYQAVEGMGTLSNGNATDGGAGDNRVNRGLAGRARPQEWVSARVPTGRVEPMTAIGCGFEATRPSLDVTPDRGSPRVAPPHHRSSSPETLSGGAHVRDLTTRRARGRGGRWSPGDRGRLGLWGCETAKRRLQQAGLTQ
jgi:hypothetical protein